ncbi:MAG: efflux RND transporter periplasmic adaptor subunit [bacterium]|nr:efflux RND transporter periplasmic adaptor subunit [bacterium]
MKSMPWKKILYLIAALIAAGAVVFALLPEPTAVDAGKVSIGPMEITVDDQGETRSHDRFVLAAPVSGRLMRIELHDGDAVAENQVVAEIAPLPLSAREREEQDARIAAAEALQREAVEHVRHAEDDLALARREGARIEALVKNGNLPAQQADQARNLEVTSVNEVKAARFRAVSAAAQVKVARSGLQATRSGGNAAGTMVKVHAPVAGRVLRITDPSERVVAAGTALLTLGNLDQLEVVIELLSSEAVKIKPGMPVRLEGWGGTAPLRAQVRRVEPFAFTKVSALGVEEKRTNVIAGFIDPPGTLGDGFRVTGRIVVWQKDNVLKVPASALFRCGEAWCTFTIENDRAVRRTVDIGQRNALEAQVLQGLSAGQTVIRHPGNQIENHARVRIRGAGT